MDVVRTGVETWVSFWEQTPSSIGMVGTPSGSSTKASGSLQTRGWPEDSGKFGRGTWPLDPGQIERGTWPVDSSRGWKGHVAKMESRRGWKTWPVDSGQGCKGLGFGGERLGALQAKRQRCFSGAPDGQCYLRIGVCCSDGTAPGDPLVLEIWPPGCFSPIHNHGGVYGLVRILHGEVRSTSFVM